MKKLFGILIICTLSNIVFAQEIIPFELKDDNRIYLKAFINKSDTLNMVFDLGANITVINKTRMKAKNVIVKFDTIVSNAGGNGNSDEDKSFKNQVTIGNQNYKEIEILGISYPEVDLLDGIIGWNFFKDKIVQIDYDYKELLIFDNLPELSKGYNKHKLKYINGLPYIEILVYKGKKKVKIWAMLDTGYNSTLKVYYKSVIENKLSNQYQVIGESTSYGTDGNIVKSDLVLVPKFDIGGFEIYNMPADLIKTKVDSPNPALLGGNLLKRFHMVLDFKGKVVYIKPNSLINSSF